MFLIYVPEKWQQVPYREKAENFAYIPSSESSQLNFYFLRKVIETFHLQILWRKVKTKAIQKNHMSIASN